MHDWQQRAELFRLQEWALHEKMIDSASAAAEGVRKHPRRVSLLQIARVFELASTLGRRAVGMPLDYTEPKKFEPPFSQPDIEEALRRAYGPEGTN